MPAKEARDSTTANWSRTLLLVICQHRKWAGNKGSMVGLGLGMVLGHLEMEHRKETRMTAAPTCSKSVTNPHTNKRLETSMLHFEIWAGMLWSSRCFPVPILISQSWIVLARCGCHKKLRREAELGVGKFVSKKVPEKGRFNRVLNFLFLGCGFWMNSLMTKFHCQKTGSPSFRIHSTQKEQTREEKQNLVWTVD